MSNNENNSKNDNNNSNNTNNDTNNEARKMLVLILYDITVKIRSHIGPRTLKHHTSGAYNPETCIPKNQEA